MIVMRKKIVEHLQEAAVLCMVRWQAVGNGIYFKHQLKTCGDQLHFMGLVDAIVWSVASGKVKY